MTAASLMAQSPDVVLVNGKIVTVDDRFSIAQAVAIRGDRFVSVGTTAEITRLAGPQTRRIDLRGRTVIPGLIDNHIHLLREAWTYTRELRFDNVTSRVKAVEMLRARLKAAGPGEWVYNVGGWTHQQFADDPRAFTTQELDQIAPNNPVAMQESYFQVTLNSKGMEALGIKAGVPDPPDFLKGSIQRDAAGKPTGIVKGDINGTRAVANKMPKVAPAELESSTAALIKEMNRGGVTTVGVPGCDPDVLKIFEKWRAAGTLSIRTFCIEGTAAANPEQVERTIQQLAPLKLRLFQGDSFIDTISFGESVYGPLHDPMFAVESNPTAEQLDAWKHIAREIAKAGMPLHVHAELPRTIDAFLDQIEAINKEYPIHNLRWVFAHLNGVNAAQLGRMQKLGMYAAVHPWAITNGGYMHDAFGDGASAMPPLRTIQNSGIVWGFGTDGTAANEFLPFTTLQFAVTGQMVGGAKVDREPISREDALIAHTRKNSWFVFQEDNLGSIQPGKLADLVVLDRDYLTVLAEQIHTIQPAMTMVAGRVVFEAGTN
jgi:hypothetical protein